MIKEKTEKILKSFTSKDLYSENKISSDQIFVDSEFYAINILKSIFSFVCFTETFCSQ